MFQQINRQREKQIKNNLLQWSCTYIWNINWHDEDYHEWKVPGHECGQRNKDVVLSPATIVKMNESRETEDDNNVDRQQHSSHVSTVTLKHHTAAN